MVFDSMRVMRVMVFGTFDRLHPGHRFVIEEACRRGATHVSVARDATVERIKGKKPRQPEEERARAIREVFPNVHVSLGDPDDYLVPVRETTPDLILLGYDQMLPPGIALEDLPCRVERLPAYKPERYKSSLRQEDA